MPPFFQISKFILFFFLITSQCTLALSAFIPGIRTQQSRSTSRSTPDSESDGIQQVIEDAYIVVIKRKVRLDQLRSHLNFVNTVLASESKRQWTARNANGDGGEVGIKRIYEYALVGYSGSFSHETLRMIMSRPEVDYVEVDQVIYNQGLPAEIEHRQPQPEAERFRTQFNSTWNLARISHRDPLRGVPKKTNKHEYKYNQAAGKDVCVYVIDSGIASDHPEFEGRASWAHTVSGYEPDQDEIGHGTHVAGIIGSKTFGVAKKANLISVKAFDESGKGTVSDTLSALDYAVKDYASKKRCRVKCARGAVINMSFVSGKSAALREGAETAFDLGMHVVAAAGNFARDACSYSPSNSEKIIIVGSSTRSDEMGFYSNHGGCVSVFAPGDNVESLTLDTLGLGGVNTNMKSGTSIACAHVSGLVAYFLSIADGNSPLDQDRVSSSALIAGNQNGIVGPFLQALLGTLWGWPWSNLRQSPSSISLSLLDSDDSTSTLQVGCGFSISPQAMKEMILALATPDAIRGSVPKGTTKKLVFNNATDSY